MIKPSSIKEKRVVLTGTNGTKLYISRRPIFF